MNVPHEPRPDFDQLAFLPSDYGTLRAVYQDRSGDRVGNCFSACLATLLQIDLEETRTFHAEYLEAASRWDPLTERERWNWLASGRANPVHDVVDGWLALHGRVAVFTALAVRGWSIACGDNHQGVPHACVALDGELVHDPNPRKARGAADWGLRSVDHFIILLEAACSRVR